jgi:hemerythrin
MLMFYCARGFPMDTIKWRDDFSVNVAESDKQHQKIIQLINYLNDSLRARKGKEDVGRIIEELISYAQIHFIFEENCFDELDYPDSVEHKKAHNEYIDKVFEYLKGYNSGSIGIAVEVRDFLSNWWTNHIQISDRKYGPFFNTHGII